jgi:hypothetical protein
MEHGNEASFQEAHAEYTVKRRPLSLFRILGRRLIARHT